jgi:hypothetical protein
MDSKEQQMDRPYLSHFATVAEFSAAFSEWEGEQEKIEVNFCSLVAARVEEQFGLQDGADLCFNLQEARVIAEDASIDEAARIVAMHMLQA